MKHHCNDCGTELDLDDSGYEEGLCEDCADKRDEVQDEATALGI